VISLDGRELNRLGLGGGSPRNVPRTILPDIHPPQTGNALYVFTLPDNK